MIMKYFMGSTINRFNTQLMQKATPGCTCNINEFTTVGEYCIAVAPTEHFNRSQAAFNRKDNVSIVVNNIPSCYRFCHKIQHPGPVNGPILAMMPEVAIFKAV